LYLISRFRLYPTAAKKIQSMANILRLSEVVCLAATRLYTLAVEHKFTKGRKSLNVVAVCLYVACRQKETRNYMLIDFSDLLQVNVFELGHTYLQLVQTLNLRLPLVDPSHYISRFAALLEFGDETPRVAHDAVRLVQRFDRDWLARGRRPAGICGAALLLAARMNNFRRSVAEIVQVVKIADTTLKKRLEEFRASPSSSLTLADFRNVWLEEEMDPPAFTKGREREETRKRKRRGSDVEGDGSHEKTTTRPPIDPALLNEGILAGALPLFIPEYDSNIDPVLLSPLPPPLRPSSPPLASELPLIPATQTVLDLAISDEVSTFLNQSQGAQLASALDEE
jgi:transcription factor IIIB subunit 2